MSEPDLAKTPSLGEIEANIAARTAAIRASVNELPRLSQALAVLRGEEYVEETIDFDDPAYTQLKSKADAWEHLAEGRLAELRDEQERSKKIAEEKAQLEHRIRNLELRIDDETGISHEAEQTIDEQRRTIRQLSALKEAQAEEIESLKGVLAKHRERISELETLLDEATTPIPTKPDHEAKPEPPPAEPEKELKDETTGRWTGGTTQLIKAEQVRDLIQSQVHLRREPFRLGQILPFFPGVSDQTIKRRINELVQHGVLETRGRGAGTRYVLSKAAPEKVSRRNVEAEVMRDAGVGREAAKRGQIVPHTKTEGPSGKPGMDKKRSARGVRVKRERQGT